MNDETTGCVLIVDDDEDIHAMLRYTLEHAGISVLCAQDAYEAIALLHQNKVDVILLDVLMPGEDGFHFHQRLLKSDRWKELPILFLTSVGNEERILEAYAKGAEDYITKPFVPQVVAAKVKKIISRQRKLQSLNQDNLLPGYQIGGKYVILREIGRGGMGFVYLARHTQTSQLYAIKVFYTRGSSAEHRQRFQEEIKTLSSLSHPNLIRLYDAGQQDHFIFYAMDYLTGGSLYDRITKRGALREEEALSLCGDIASALQHAHDRGIYHRDLKSENILFNNFGEPVLTDFGVALNLFSHNERLTKTGFVVGTVPYLSPEQVLGVDEADHRADIFSLGIIFYEMLTGQHPFPGEAPHDIMTRILRSPHTPVRKLNPRLSEETQRICDMALTKDREQRYQQASELSLACKQTLDYIRYQKNNVL
ncbi:MAG: protein kinase [Myxococcales bacterium]|nr:protein kinase [Myxococcales bacterium]